MDAEGSNKGEWERRGYIELRALRTLRCSSRDLALLRYGSWRVLAVPHKLARLEAERLVVDTAELPQEDEEETRPREDIEDAVPDHLARGGNDVSALAACPADRVGDEHEGEVRRRDAVALADGAACGESRARCMPEEDVPVQYT